MKALLLSAALTLASCHPVVAQALCAPMEKIQNDLQEIYGEKMLGIYMSSDGEIATFWGNADTGTWTAVHMRRDGLACLLKAGRGWDGIVPPIFDRVQGA